jgi:hypothetical protein
MENGADGYHVSSVHWNYSATMGHPGMRSASESQTGIGIRHSANLIFRPRWSASLGFLWSLISWTWFNIPH